MVSREAGLRMGARNAELNSINSPPMELGMVDGVHQGQLLEGVGHSVDLLPLGPRGPLHLLGDGLGQHVLRGRGPIFLHILEFSYFLFTFAAALGRGRLHAHAEPSEFISFRVEGYRGSVTVCVIVVGLHGGGGGRGRLALSLHCVDKTHVTNFVFAF